MSNRSIAGSMFSTFCYQRRVISSIGFTNSKFSITCNALFCVVANLFRGLPLCKFSLERTPVELLSLLEIVRLIESSWVEGDAYAIDATFRSLLRFDPMMELR